MLARLRYLLFPVLNIIGTVLLIFSGIHLLGLAVSTFFGDGAAYGFFFGAALSACGALVLIAVTRHDKRDLLPRDGFLLATLLWSVLPVFAALPIMTLPNVSFSQAYFEAMSGITTTCATAFSVENLPESINFWRCLLSWLGGMGILVLAIALLPLMGVGGSQLFRFVNLCQAAPSISPLFGIGTNKSSVTNAEIGSTIEATKLTPRIASTAKGLWWIYMGLSLACFVGYKLAGMSGFDALVHAFSTVSLGGFSSHDASFAFWSDNTINLVCILFMLISGMSFSLHFLVWKKRSPLLYLQDPEARAWLFVLASGVLVVFAVLMLNAMDDSTSETFLYALFNVVSIASTTGFASTDYSHWPVTASVIMLCLAAFSTCSGSVGGGIKMLRALILTKQLSRGFLQTLHPKAVIPLRINRVTIPDPIVFMVLNFIVLWVAALLTASVLLVASGLDVASAFSAVFACLTNTGPGLEKVGPSVNYGTLSAFQLWLCTFCMLIGRLEIVTVFVLFTRDFWRV